MSDCFFPRELFMLRIHSVQVAAQRAPVRHSIPAPISKPRLIAPPMPPPPVTMPPGRGGGATIGSTGGNEGGDGGRNGGMGGWNGGRGGGIGGVIRTGACTVRLTPGRLRSRASVTVSPFGLLRTSTSPPTTVVDVLADKLVTVDEWTVTPMNSVCNRSGTTSVDRYVRSTITVAVGSWSDRERSCLRCHRRRLTLHCSSFRLAHITT